MKDSRLLWETPTVESGLVHFRRRRNYLEDSLCRNNVCEVICLRTGLHRTVLPLWGFHRPFSPYQAPWWPALSTSTASRRGGRVTGGRGSKKVSEVTTKGNRPSVRERGWLLTKDRDSWMKDDRYQGCRVGSSHTGEWTTTLLCRRVTSLNIDGI